MVAIAGKHVQKDRPTAFFPIFGPKQVRRDAEQERDQLPALIVATRRLEQADESVLSELFRPITIPR